MAFTTYNELSTGIALKFHVKNEVEITANNDEHHIHYKFIYGDGRRVYDKTGNCSRWNDEEPYSKYTQEEHANWVVLTQAVINGGTPNPNVSIEFDRDYDLLVNINGDNGIIVLFVSKETNIPNVEYDYDKFEYKYINKPTNLNIDQEIGKKEIVQEINYTFEQTTALRIENYVLKQRIDAIESKLDKLIKSFE